MHLGEPSYENGVGLLLVQYDVRLRHTAAGPFSLDL